MLGRLGLIGLAAGALAEVSAHEPGSLAVVAEALILPVFAANAWIGRARDQDAAQRTTAAARRALAEQIDRALRAERVRLARELHDVTSHAVGVMVLQGGAAQALRETDARRAREALVRVDEAGTVALAEIEELVEGFDTGAFEALKEPDADDAAVSLASRIHDLVARMRRAGLDLELRISATPHDQATAAALFRIVQESLTNVARHAPASHVAIEIGRTGEQWVVRILDDGPGPVPGRAPGFGLVGLSERVSALGGTLDVGRAPSGTGFQVVARLPDVDALDVARPDDTVADMVDD